MNDVFSLEEQRLFEEEQLAKVIKLTEESLGRELKERIKVEAMVAFAREQGERMGEIDVEDGD